MATSLIVEFVDANNDTRSITWSNIDPETTASTIRTFINGVITASSSLLRVALTSAKSAKLRTTTESPVNLNP